MPVSMDEEGGGPKSPFWPSSSKTNVGGIIPSNFFMDSELCGECHKDIYEQWNSSMHHFASFNNQFYRKSIEYMQAMAGTQPSKWCAGCHDHAVFFNGRFETPIKEQIDTPEAQAGLGCMSCHSITHVDRHDGQRRLHHRVPAAARAGYPAATQYIRALDYFLTYLDPEPHRQTFMKPFMRLDSAEFCSSCHKVHLDVPVNNYRWFRGFNDYDNWQASGVSGQGARSFYYPPKSPTCARLPHAAGGVEGSRATATARSTPTASRRRIRRSPYVNKDEKQLEETEEFLQSGFITVDIFAVSPVDDEARTAAMVRRARDGPAAGVHLRRRRGGRTGRRGVHARRRQARRAARRGRARSSQPGSTVRVDVVVRTRKIGHFFPGGTVDAFDVWLELQGKDADGQVVFWSGRVGGRREGPGRAGRALLPLVSARRRRQSDQQAQCVAGAQRAVRPADSARRGRRRALPGARFRRTPGPDHAARRSSTTASSRTTTRSSPTPASPNPGRTRRWSSVASRQPEYSLRSERTSRRMSRARSRTGSRICRSSRWPRRPSTLAGGRRARRMWKPVVRKKDRERWNDWGIGMLLQGDLKGAEYAFTRVTEAEPGTPTAG